MLGVPKKNGSLKGAVSILLRIQLSDGRRTGAKTAPRVPKPVPLSFRWKTQTHPSFLLCCRGWNFLLNNAALAAEQYCAPAVPKRSASLEQRERAAA
jgi:hypothetical protein